jgi:hypothetical protein
MGWWPIDTTSIMDVFGNGEGEKIKVTKSLNDDNLSQSQKYWYPLYLIWFII